MSTNSSELKQISKVATEAVTDSLSPPNTQITRIRRHDVKLPATYQTNVHTEPPSCRRSLLIGPKAAVRGTSAAPRRPDVRRYVRGPLQGLHHNPAVEPPAQRDRPNVGSTRAQRD